MGLLAHRRHRRRREGVGRRDPPDSVLGQNDYPKLHVDPDPWRDYIRHVAERYAADIPVFEIWNEQDLRSKDNVGNQTNYLAVLWRRPADADAKREGKPLGADAGMLWTKDSAGDRRILRFTSDAVRFFDHLGAEVWPTPKDGGYEMDVTDKPTYFVGGELNP